MSKVTKNYNRTSVQEDIEVLDLLAEWMDNKFRVPGTKITFGIDSLLGLIPGIGDTISLAVSGYVLKRARHYQAPKSLQAKMIWHIFIDWLIGLIPFLGDIFDVGYKANIKNVALLKKHLDENQIIT